jgi:hypothetical protein
MDTLGMIIAEEIKEGNLRYKEIDSISEQWLVQEGV